MKCILGILGYCMLFGCISVVLHFETVLVQCWPNVYDIGPALSQHCFKVSCLLGIMVEKDTQLLLLAECLIHIPCRHMVIILCRVTHGCCKLPRRFISCLIMRVDNLVNREVTHLWALSSHAVLTPFNTNVNAIKRIFKFVYD